MVLGNVSTAEAAKGKSASKSKPLRGVIYRQRRVGGYSYKYVDSVNTRRFIDPPTQSLSGPFGSGFFFVTPVPTFGGQSPYMH